MFNVIFSRSKRLGKLIAVVAPFIAFSFIEGCCGLFGGSVASAAPTDNFKSIDDFQQSNAINGVELTELFGELGASSEYPEPDISVKVETSGVFKVGQGMGQFLPQLSARIRRF